jgi:hypothetical protein
MDCMCGFEGAKGIGLWDGTTMDEGFLFQPMLLVRTRDGTRVYTAYPLGVGV